MTNKPLGARSAIVFGGASGIGRAAVLELARQGASVGAFDVDTEKLATLRRELDQAGARFVADSADVTRRGDVDGAVDAVAGEFGQVDIVVNCAGIADYVPFWEVDDERWDRVIAINLKGAYYGMQAALRHMMPRRSGRIINISSVGGVTGTPLHTHYSASKAGMIGLTKAVAKEVAEYGITVNAVAPGLIDTPLSQEKSPLEWKDWVVERTPMKRLGRVEEISGVIAFLASDPASYITGQVISPNGGYVI